MRFCTNCGARIEGTPKFCRECGYPVAGAPVAPLTASEPTRTASEPEDPVPAPKPLIVASPETTRKASARRWRLVAAIALLMVAAVAIAYVGLSGRQGRTTVAGQGQQDSAAAIYAPTQGSAEREALIEAALAHSSPDNRFTVDELYVLGDWAVGNMSIAGYDDVAYNDLWVWKKADGHWKCIAQVEGDSMGMGKVPDPIGNAKGKLAALGVPTSLVQALEFK